MKKTVIASFVAAAMTSSVPAFAGVAEELAAMKERIAQLESQLAAQQAKLSQQEETASSGGFAENVSVSGVLELVANHVEEDGGNSASDIAVDTFEIGIEAEVNELVTLSSLIEYNSDDNDIELSEAFAVIGNEDSPAVLTAGLAPIPFAAINDAGWTSPLTDDYFDITEGMAMLSVGSEMISADLFAYNNDEGDSINSLGLNVSLVPADGLVLGAGYVSDLADSENDLSDLASNSEDAWRINALAEIGALALSAEYIEVNGSDFDPNLLALNAAYGLDLFGAEGTLYLGYSEVDDSAADAERTVIGVERAFGENATVSAEFVRDEDNAGAETDTLNLVLVTEF